MFRKTANEINVNMSRKAPGKLIAIFALVLVLIVLAAFSVKVVDVSNKGVVVVLGKVVSVYDEGVHFVFPFISSVVQIPTREQREDSEMEVSSKDIQTIKINTAVIYSVNPEKVKDLYTKTGRNYKDVIVKPSINEVINAVIAQYNIEEFIEKRPEISQMIKNELSERLSGYGISIRDTMIVDHDFSNAFNDAIEKKKVAEQQALEEKNKLEAVKYQAEQQIEKAKGEAEAMRIKKAELTPELLQQQYIDKWDGKMPQVMSENINPFLNITNKPE